jgi:tetratricopeptide (TPR) repeat protein
LEKAIEIKRRAQRCILNGDLDGALNEYERLIASGDSDPYHSVLLADLLYKKGNHGDAASRYLEAVSGYESVGLHKNAIAVCKKMSRLSLSPGAVLQKLARLHALDGLATESSLYYMQHAELLVAEGKGPDAMKSLREAFTACSDNVRALETLAELQQMAGSSELAARTLIEAAAQYERLGALSDARRCRASADQLAPGAGAAAAAASPEAPPPRASTPPAPAKPATTPVSPSKPAVQERIAPIEASAPPTAATIGAHTGAVPPPARSTPPREREYFEAPTRDLDLDATDPAASAPSEEPFDLTARAQASEESPVSEIVEDESSSMVTFDLDASDDVVAAAPPAASTASPGTSPAEPGLVFRNGGNSTLDAAAPASAAADDDPDGGLPEVSALLNEAQALFRRGERDAASATLVRAAQAYDHLGRFDSAASIYRSLSQVNESPLQVMLLWLKNCQRRDDRREASRVACELGDRAMQDGDVAGAREWFERARAYDDQNEHASRRLKRLTGERVEDAPVAAAPMAQTPVVEASSAAAVAPEPSRAPRPGFVEVSLVREEPVGLDLGAMIADFRRGLEEQLDSDPQGHYDLGMSYREMGLYEHAIEALRTAAQSQAFSVRASELIGRCLLDQGDFDGAAEELTRTLELPELTPASAHDIRYQLGLAYEVGGRPDEALRQFERIYASEPNYPDVASKIRTLRKMLEQD